MAPFLSTFCADAAGLLVSSVWEGVALAAGVAFLLRCVPRLSAGTRSAVWTAVLALMLALPLLSLHRAHGSIPEVAGEGVLHVGAAWSFVLVGAWVLLSSVRLAQLVSSALRLRSMLLQAVPIEIAGVADELLRKGSRRVKVCVCGDVSRPSVAGFFRPRILLPVGLLEELTEAELEHVLLHELEHLRRRDDWTNLLQKVGLALLPLHPALFWLDRKMCAERELACDDRVLERTQGRKAYAACLARLAEDSMVRRGLSLALGLLGARTRRSELSVRVQRILRSPAAAMGPVQGAAAAALVFGAVLGGSALLARSPSLIRFDTAISGDHEAGLDLGSRSMLPRPALVTMETLPRVTPVKAVMPAPTPRFVRGAGPTLRKPPISRRLVLVQKPARDASRYVLYTHWQEQVEMPRLTLAIATDSQQTYAAVPVRGGWLFIQL